MKNNDYKIPVLVTTELRGVFFGYSKVDPEKLEKMPDILVLKSVRNCIYWDETVSGVFGLANTGPNNKCRIGANFENITLNKISSISIVSKAAEKTWIMIDEYKG